MPDIMTAHIESSKAIVFITCLLQLFKKCPDEACNSIIDPSNIEITNVGAVTFVKYECNEGHCGKWASSPFIGKSKERVGIINLLLSSFILTCGLHISQACHFTKNI